MSNKGAASSSHCDAEEPVWQRCAWRCLVLVLSQHLSQRQAIACRCNSAALLYVTDATTVSCVALLLCQVTTLLLCLLIPRLRLPNTPCRSEDSSSELRLALLADEGAEYIFNDCDFSDGSLLGFLSSDDSADDALPSGGGADGAEGEC